MTTQECEIALTSHLGVFHVRRYFVLPRASWGIKGINHECDMLALSHAGVLHEIEIKISRSDLLADQRKRHAHKSDIIKRLWFAVPRELVEFASTRIPADAGLIGCGISHSGQYFRSDVIRRPCFRGKDKPDQSVIKHMYELMTMRYWSERGRIIMNMHRKKSALTEGLGSSRSIPL